jgi:predicted nucleic acid-binding protein
MTARFFVDTNVLVYAASNAPADQPRRDLALELLDRPDLVISAQVLAEFYSVARCYRIIATGSSKRGKHAN